MELFFMYRHLPIFNNISSARSTRYGRWILGLLSVMRVSFFYDPLKTLIAYDYLILEREVIHTCVFLIGVLLALECLLSTLNFIYGLKLGTLLRQSKFESFSVYSVILIFCTLASFIHAVWLFMYVRHLWMQYFPVVLQILHCVPSLLLASQSITQGLFLHTVRGNVRQISVEVKDRFAEHLESQKMLNFVLLIYSILAIMAIAGHKNSFVHASCGLYALGEVLYRLFSLYAFKSLKFELQQQQQQQQEADSDSVFASAVEESMYNTKKESLIMPRL